MKLLAGIALFLLCAVAGESRSRRLQRREQALLKLHELIREIGERQLTALVSFREGALRCPPTPEREQLMDLSRGREPSMPLLTAEERNALAAYARSETRSPAALRAERDALLALLQRSREQTAAELKNKGQVYRSVGYLTGVAALLLVL